MNKRCVYSFFLNTVLVMCIMTISSESELELVGLMRQGDCFSSDLRYVLITGPGSFVEGGEQHLLVCVC